MNSCQLQVNILHPIVAKHKITIYIVYRTVITYILSKANLVIVTRRNWGGGSWGKSLALKCNDFELFTRLD